MDKCFIIQPFDGDVYDRRHDDTLVPAVKNAGLEPYRVDRDPGVVIPIDEVENGIRNSRVCIAEISTDNPNVWFELGFAIAAKRDVVLICAADRRSQFPFDVQHRHIIRYRTGSRKDLAELEENVTTRLRALLEKQGNIAQLRADSPIKDTQGLDAHEIVALVTVMQNQLAPDDGATAYQIKQDMLKAGHTELAAALSLRTLQRKGFIEAQLIQDERGDYTGFSVTDEGVNWLLANKSQLKLTRDKPKSGEFDFQAPALEDDEDLPF